MNVFFRDTVFSSSSAVRPSRTILFEVRNKLNRAKVYYYPTESRVMLSLLEGSKRPQQTAQLIQKNITLPVHFYRSHTDGTDLWLSLQLF